MKIKLLSICLSVICIGLSPCVQAQSSDSLHVKKKRLVGVKGYVGGVYERAPVGSEQTNSFGWQAAVILKNHIELGAYGQSFTSNSYRKQLIFPNNFQMNYKHAGFILGYRTSLENSFDFSLATKVGFGEVKWTQVETGSPFLADEFSLIQVQGGVDFLLDDLVALNAFVGYRWMKQLEITGLSNSDINGFFFGLAVKVGKFR